MVAYARGAALLPGHAISQDPQPNCLPTPALRSCPAQDLHEIYRPTWSRELEKLQPMQQGVQLGGGCAWWSNFSTTRRLLCEVEVREANQVARVTIRVLERSRSRTR
jgi:hypothetical protein